MRKIRIGLSENPYTIHIERNLLKKVPAYIDRLKLGNFGLIITTRKIYSLYHKSFKRIFKGSRYKIFPVIDGERAKSKKWFYRVIAEIIKIDGWDKKPFIVCLGGGTVGDLGGFAAAVYKRGIPYVQVPTTFLAQIDSSIGGKTAIDTPEAKNILGAFYQPKAVFIDPNFLLTLPLREVRRGMAEVIKYGVIKDKRFFSFLQNNRRQIMARKPDYMLKVISTCAGIKARIVAADEKEKKGLRTILNFGHTFAHALESSLKYRKVSHGEAVAIGMVYAARLSLLLKKCRPQDVAKLCGIIRDFSLPDKIDFNPQILYKSLVYDKKFTTGKIRMVLLKRIGQVEVVEGISPLNIKSILKKH